MRSYIVMILSLFLSTMSLANSNDGSTLIGKEDTFQKSIGTHASYKDIINLIRRNYKPPPALKGTVQRASLTITVNSNGDVIKVSAVGNNEILNHAAKKAVIETGNLPISNSDSLYPTFSFNFVGKTD